MTNGNRTIERVSGPGNWRLQIGFRPKGIRILKAVTCDRSAVLPEEICGVPVTEIGEGALKPEDPRGSGLEVRTGMNADVWVPQPQQEPAPSLRGAVPVSDSAEAGENRRAGAGVAEAAADWRNGSAPPHPFCLEMTDGRGRAGRWSNRGMERIRIPESVRSIGHYAFLGCDLLACLEMTDGKTEFGSGVFMNCPLHDLILHRPAEEGSVLSYFAYELARELDVRILDPDGQVSARALFPEYYEIATDNVEARQFNYDMVGIGYPYHHVFRSRKLDWHEYDRLWERCLAHGTEEELAGRIAWFRLRWPLHLSEMFREPYLEYLKAHAAGMMLWCLEHGSAADLSAMVSMTKPSETALRTAAEAARERGKTDCLAVLMANERTAVPAGRRKTFEL